MRRHLVGHDDHAGARALEPGDLALLIAQAADAVFIVIVAVADVFGIPIAQYLCYCVADRFDTAAVAMMSVVWYLGTVGAYVILISVFKLLNNMSKDIVFDRVNTRLMSVITAALIGIGFICVAGGFVWFGAYFLTIISLFMALIVMCVKVVFAKAIAMKEGMDLTI